jgi:hypothetical protein
VTATNGNNVARFTIDLPGFSRWLPATREGPSCLSDPESPNVAKNHEFVTRFEE